MDSVDLVKRRLERGQTATAYIELIDIDEVEMLSDAYLALKDGGICLPDQQPPPLTSNEFQRYVRLVYDAIKSTDQAADATKANKDGGSDKSASVEYLDSLGMFEIQLVAGKLVKAVHKAQSGVITMPSWPITGRLHFHKYSTFAERMDQVILALKTFKSFGKALFHDAVTMEKRLAMQPGEEANKTPAAAWPSPAVAAAFASANRNRSGQPSEASISALRPGRTFRRPSPRREGKVRYTNTFANMIASEDEPDSRGSVGTATPQDGNQGPQAGGPSAKQGPLSSAQGLPIRTRPSSDQELPIRTRPSSAQGFPIGTRPSSPQDLPVPTRSWSARGSPFGTRPSHQQNPPPPDYQASQRATQELQPNGPRYYTPFPKPGQQSCIDLIDPQFLLKNTSQVNESSSSTFEGNGGSISFNNGGTAIYSSQSTINNYFQGLPTPLGGQPLASPDSGNDQAPETYFHLGSPKEKKVSQSALEGGNSVPPSVSRNSSPEFTTADPQVEEQDQDDQDQADQGDKDSQDDQDQDNRGQANRDQPKPSLAPVSPFNWHLHSGRSSPALDDNPLDLPVDPASPPRVLTNYFERAMAARDPDPALANFPRNAGRGPRPPYPVDQDLEGMDWIDAYAIMDVRRIDLGLRPFYTVRWQDEEGDREPREEVQEDEE